VRVLAAFFKYDYGEPSRGFSNEHLVWVEQLRLSGVDLDVFYLEENGYPQDVAGLQESLIEHVSETRPDAVFFMFMRDEIALKTLDRLNELTRTVNWFCDDQWRFETYTVYRAPHLSLCLTVDKYCLEKYRRSGYQNVQLVSWGPSHHLPDVIPLPDRYEFEVSFVGQCNPTRAWLVDQLKARGVAVECFGPGWPQGKVSFERMREIFYRSAINLNLSNSVPSDRSYQKFARSYDRRSAWIDVRGSTMRRLPGAILRLLKSFLPSPTQGPKNREQMKARYFEIAACGGFQLGRMVLGLDDHFVIGKEIAVYTDVNEIVEQVKYYLAHESERQEMAQAAFQRVKAFQYHAQLRRVFESMA